MKHSLIRFLAALLAVVLLVPAAFAEPDYTPYSEIVYERPDLDEMDALAQKVITLSQGKNARKVLSALFDLYDAMDWFDTCYCLADIRCSADLSDDYWQEEYAFCMSAASGINWLEAEVYEALAASPCRAQLEAQYFGTDFLTAYDAVDDQNDDAVSDLLEQESSLVSEYYSLNAEDNHWFSIFKSTDEKKAQLLVDLIRVRNQLAALSGYDSYEAYANDLYYYRDYTTEQMDVYLEAIRTELVPVYTRTGDFSDLPATTEAATLDYVRRAVQNMGSVPEEAFALMENAGLYDIAYSPKKYSSSFEVYLTSYQEPFLFMCPEGTTFDHLTLAHEFGHYCNDYASGGTYVGVDVMEIFSQGMEYLSLFYGEDTEALTRVKLTDSLCTYVEQAMYAVFEREMYRIPDDELTTSALEDLFSRTAEAFGMEYMGYFDTEFVTVTHFYTNPMYICSYIVSNDAAMQFYTMELQEPGTGLSRYLENLDTDEPYFLAFLKTAGLEDPFNPARLTELRVFFETMFPE